MPDRVPCGWPSPLSGSCDQIVSGRSRSSASNCRVPGPSWDGDASSPGGRAEAQSARFHGRHWPQPRAGVAVASVSAFDQILRMASASSLCAGRECTLNRSNAQLAPTAHAEPTLDIHRVLAEGACTDLNLGLCQIVAASQPRSAVRSRLQPASGDRHEHCGHLDPTRPRGHRSPFPYDDTPWIEIVVSVFPLCRWFAGFKARRRDWWLSYVQATQATSGLAAVRQALGRRHTRSTRPTGN
jgi:hypothetical protein